VERTFLRDRRGAEVWIVAIRATFDIKPDGRVAYASKQEPVTRAPIFLGDPSNSTLKYDGDLVLAKDGVDMVLHGHAYAPGARPVPTLDVAVRAGRWSKVVRVHGDRLWVTGHAGGLVPGRTVPFIKMPLRYERAWGGTDPAGDVRNLPSFAPDNPAGQGFARNPAVLLGRPVPNLEDPRQPIGAGAGPFRVAGFAPVASHWAPRARYAGTYDDKWKAERAPLLPEDFDDRFYRLAPVDQQFPAFASDGQLFELINLTPSSNLPLLLPKLRFWANTKFKDGEARHDVALHTIIIEPDYPRVQMVWHTSLPCHGREHLLERSRIHCEGEPACLVPAT
jgi:hypothetical protein